MKKVCGVCILLFLLIVAAVSCSKNEPSEPAAATATMSVTETLTITTAATFTATATTTSTLVTVEIKCAGDASACSAQDVCITEFAPAVNTNTWTVSTIGTNGTGMRRRTLLYFDLSSIPSSAEITEARLLYNVDAYAAAGASLSFTGYTLTSSWIETTETWSTHSGGSYLLTPSHNASPVTGTGLWTLFLNLGVVQGWVDGSLSNYGIILISSTESAAADDYINISTKEYADETKRPYLRVKYRF